MRSRTDHKYVFPHRVQILNGICKGANPVLIPDGGEYDQIHFPLDHLRKAILIEFLTGGILAPDIIDIEHRGTGPGGGLQEVNIRVHLRQHHINIGRHTVADDQHVLALRIYRSARVRVIRGGDALLPPQHCGEKHHRDSRYQGQRHCQALHASDILTAFPERFLHQFVQPCRGQHGNHKQHQSGAGIEFKSLLKLK